MKSSQRDNPFIFLKLGKEWGKDMLLIFKNTTNSKPSTK